MSNVFTRLPKQCLINLAGRTRGSGSRTNSFLKNRRKFPAPKSASLRTRPACSRVTCSETRIYIPSCLSTSSGGLVASGKLTPHTLRTSFKCVCRRSGGPGGGEGGLPAARRGGGGPASRPGRHAGRAVQVGSELKAELGNVHTLSGKPAGEVSESQRGGALGTRAGRERARARGGRGRRPERAQLGPSEPRGAQSWERPAGGRAPLSHPSTAAPGAAPSSAEPHPGALAPPRRPGTGGGSARSRPVPPARDSSADQPAQVLRACGPPGGSHDPRRAAAAESRGTRGRPGRRGRSARKRPRSRGGEPGRPASSAGRSRALGQCLTGALSPPGGLGKRGGNPLPRPFPGTS